MSTTLLSVLLPTTPDRRPLFYSLLSDITNQLSKHGHSEIVEVLIDEDNREKSIGKKRQELLEKATGEFIVYCDSDDSIHNSYFNHIIDALKANPNVDHCGFLEKCRIDGVESDSIFSIKHKVWAEETDGYNHIRCANPKSVVRRTKALQAGFPDLRFGEDRVYSEKVTPLLESEVFIDKYLYYYTYISTPGIDRYGENNDK